MWFLLMWFLIGAVGGIGFFNSERTDWYVKYKKDLPENLKRSAFIISICMTALGILGLALSYSVVSGKYTLFYKGK